MRLPILLSLVFFVLSSVAGSAADNAPRIILYTLGPVPKDKVNLTIDVVHSAYGYYVDYRGKAALLDNYGPDEDNVYFARKILNDMDVIAAVEDTRVLVLTEYKLRRTDGIKTTCGGLSHSSRGTALFTTYKTDGGNEEHTTVLSRLIKRILHETGHASGLHHCKQPLCYMTAFANADGNDTTHFVLCPRCSLLLEEKTGINYAIAREFLINILIEMRIIDDTRNNYVKIPPPPDDLSYDLTGTEKIGKPPEDREK